MEKVIDFEDKDTKFVLLGRGDYLIDGNVVSITETYNKTRVSVKNENDIRIIKTTTVTDYYINTEDDSRMTKLEFEEKQKELLSHRKWNDYDDEIWDSLEDEFNYRKFKQLWVRVDKSIQTLSDPILVEKVSIKYDTGNKFINNAYLNGTDKQHDLYVYNRSGAYLSIVEECFNELNMEFKDDCGYNYTKNRKVWGNSSHSCIRYVVAFGEYIFDDRFKNAYSAKGTLEDMVKLYEKDRDLIREIIKTKYNTAFGKLDEGKLDFKLMLKDLYALRGNINSIESKKSTYGIQNNAYQKVNEIINYLEKKFE